MKNFILVPLALASFCACATPPPSQEQQKTNLEQRLYPASLNILLRPGDIVLTDCSSEFDPKVNFTTEERAGLQCVQPQEGQTKESFDHYRDTLKAAGFTSVPGNPQSGANFEFSRNNEKISALVLSYRFFNRPSIENKEESNADAERILRSLPIAFFYEETATEK